MRDDAVAEVIGVILIVVITVVVAAIVASFAIGMGSSVKKPYMVYYTLDRSTPSTNIIITNIGGPDIKLLQKVEISYTNNMGQQIDFAEPDTIIANNPGHVYGDLCTQPTTSLELDSTIVKPNGDCHVIVRGTFIDGSQQVLMQGDI